MVQKQIIDRKQFVKINLTRNSKIHKTAQPDTIDVRLGMSKKNFVWTSTVCLSLLTCHTNCQIPILDPSNGTQHLYYYP